MTKEQELAINMLIKALQDVCANELEIVVNQQTGGMGLRFPDGTYTVGGILPTGIEIKIK